MKTFHEWLEAEHPELLDEWLRDIAKNRTVRNLVAGAAMFAGGLGMAGGASGAEPSGRPAAQETEQASFLSRRDKALYELAKTARGKLNRDEQDLLSHYLKFKTMLGQGQEGPRMKAAEGSLGAMVRGKFQNLHSSNDSFDSVGDYLWGRMSGSGSGPVAASPSAARPMAKPAGGGKVNTRSESPDLD